VTYWRQRAKIKNCTLEDENSRYYHLSASGRLRKNQIKNLETEHGNTVFAHQAKADILLRFFKDLLGNPLATSNTLDLASLVASTRLDPFQANTLIKPSLSLWNLRGTLLHEWQLQPRP
jgi:hypothetical protein